MNFRKYYLLVMVAVGWFALIAQFVLMLQTRKVDLGESLIRFFSYFTILTNLLVAILFTGVLLGPKARIPAVFFRGSVQSAAAVYITVVGLVYNSLLRGLVPLSGLSRLVDELLHTVVPLLVVMYWYVWTDGRNLRWSHIFPWLIYPAVYFGYVIVRGHFANFYPYPFVDVRTYGYQGVVVNSAGVLLVFVLSSLLYIWIGRNKSHRDLYLV